MTQQTFPEDSEKVGGLLKNLKIGTKLTLGFGILVILMLLNAGASYQGSNKATIRINQTDDIRVPTALAASRAQANLLRMLGDVRGYLALGDQQYRNNYIQSKYAFDVNLAELESLYAELGEENQARLDELEDVYADWVALPPQLFELRDDQLDREPAYRLLAIDGIKYAGQVLIAINTLIEMQGRREPTAGNLELLQDMAKFQGNFAAMLSALRGYVTTRNRIYRGEYEVNLVDNQNAWERLNDTHHHRTLTSTQEKLVREIDQNREAFLQLPEKIFETLESEQWRLDLYKFSTEAVVYADKMQQLLGEMTENQQTQLETELGEGRQELLTANQRILVGGLAALIFGVAMSFIFRANIAGPVRRLTDVAERIRGGDLHAQAQVESVDETGILARTFNSMTTRLRDTLFQVTKEKKRADDLLDVVIPIGVELSSEKDFNRLLEKMLVEAKTFCHADSGTVYLRTDDDHLKYEIMRNDTKNLALGGTTGQKIHFTPLSLHEQQERKPEDRNIAAVAALTGDSMNIPDYNRPSEVVEEYQVHSLLTIPLKNNVGQVRGVLQLINAKDPESQMIIPFDQNLQQMMESFSSLAIAALEAYIREQNLKNEIKQLRIEIDEAKRKKQVREITESESFFNLQTQAAEMRERRNKHSSKKRTSAGQSSENGT
jgi:CHASE3 domain sensor protein